MSKNTRFVAEIDCGDEMPPDYMLDDASNDDEYRPEHRKVEPKLKNLPPRLKIGSDVEIAELIARDLHKRHGEVIYSEGQFWHFTGKRWEQLALLEIQRIAKSWDGKFWGTAGDVHPVKLSVSRIKSIVACLTIELQRDDFFNGAPVGVNCQNGFVALNLDTGALTLTGHDRLQRQQYIIPAEWPEGESEALSVAELPQASFLRKLTMGSFQDDPEADDKRAVIEEALAAALFGIATRIASPKAIVFHGPDASNGKGQFLNMIRGILPSDAVSTVSPNQFHDEKYILELASKRLNTSDELGTAKAIAGDKFKSVVAGDPIMARTVFLPAVSFRSRAQHIFACNELPSFTGGFDRGVYRRLLVLDFNRVIPEDERIPGLGEKIARDEPQLVLRLAVNGLRRLLMNNKFTEPKSSKIALESWAGGSDPAIGWAQDRLVDNRAGLKDENGKDPEKLTKDVYGDFCEWYRNEGYDEKRRPGVRTLTQRVKALGSKYGFRYKEANSKRKLVGMMFKSPGGVERFDL